MNSHVRTADTVMTVIIEESAIAHRSPDINTMAIPSKGLLIWFSPQKLIVFGYDILIHYKWCIQADTFTIYFLGIAIN